MPVHVLCVDDDPYLTDLLRYALSRDGYAVDVAGTGDEALRIAQASRPDIVILDRNLPDRDGFALCGQFRRTLHIPVIMLTASSADADAARGFESGADDYIGKPFSMRILGYRIRAVLRRGTPSHPTAGPAQIIYQLGSGTFHAEHYEVAGSLGHVTLTPTQGKILRLLLENQGRVVPARQIMDKVWPFQAESDVAVVKTHVSNLRKKLAGAIDEEEVIHNVAGIGYSVRLPPRVLEQEAPSRF